ncbi:SA1320 family protein [Neobacillus mesonae]|uniref:SA1320 family protein n=1 Tax=Neobacillus mesonae TaxID=1193713 RepID=UPI002E25096A|nr:hypothetical protein [Neobacillus mesonae]
MNSSTSFKIKYDNDLVELAGYHAYISHRTNDRLKVNGNDYLVVNTRYDHPSGLDAMTVVNDQTGELTIVFAGTADKKDVFTDAQLLSKIIPAQIQAANDYYGEMAAKYGKITNVCGNSLGGATTNAVGVAHPEVKAVTLNPALLPEGIVDPNQSYSNITNYFSIYDVLTKTEMALGLDNRIPGNRYEINNGIPEFAKLATNHTGYLRENDGRQYYTIGQKGQPGYGVIYVDADTHIMTNIWTGKPLYGGSQKIEINEGNLRILEHSLGTDVHHQLSRAKEYMKHSLEIVKHETSKFRQRVQKLQENFTDSFENQVGDPIFKGITSTGNMFKFQIDILLTFLNKAEGYCCSLNLILNSPPMELVEHIYHVNISVEHLFDQARRYLNQIKQQIEELTNVFHFLIHEKVPELFKGGADHFADAVVGEINGHYHIIDRNHGKVSKQLSEFTQQVSDTATTFAQRDQALAAAIGSKSSFVAGTIDVQKTNNYHLEVSKYMTLRMRLKQVHLDLVFEKLKTTLYKMVLPILITIQKVLSTIESVLETTSFTIKNIMTNIVIYGNVKSLVLSLFTDYEDKVRAKVRQALAPLDEAAATVEGVRKGVDRLILHFPRLVNNLRPYIDSALFHPGNYMNLHFYNTAAVNILKDMQLLFKDIVFQLSDEKGLSIEALCKVSKDVLKNMGALEEQVQRVTLT